MNAVGATGTSGISHSSGAATQGGARCPQRAAALSERAPYLRNVAACDETSSGWHNEHGRSRGAHSSRHGSLVIFVIPRGHPIPRTTKEHKEHKERARSPGAHSSRHGSLVILCFFAAMPILKRLRVRRDSGPPIQPRITRMNTDGGRSRLRRRIVSPVWQAGRADAAGRRQAAIPPDSADGFTGTGHLTLWRKRSGKAGVEESLARGIGRPSRPRWHHPIQCSLARIGFRAKPIRVTLNATRVPPLSPNLRLNSAGMVTRPRVEHRNL
jgi:hypothetical protein